MPDVLVGIIDLARSILEAGVAIAKRIVRTNHSKQMIPDGAESEDILVFFHSARAMLESKATGELSLGVAIVSISTKSVFVDTVVLRDWRFNSYTMPSPQQSTRYSGFSVNGPTSVLIEVRLFEKEISTMSHSLPHSWTVGESLVRQASFEIVLTYRLGKKTSRHPPKTASVRLENTVVVVDGVSGLFPST